MWGICLQHAVGGALCLPALLPAWFPNVSHAAALSMVRWGALCEVAWEVTDTLKRVYVEHFDIDHVSKVNRSYGNAAKGVEYVCSKTNLFTFAHHIHT